MVLSFIIAVLTILITGAAWTALRSFMTTKTVDNKESCVKKRPPSFGPESFLNHIKSELPRGHGLIYEVSTRIYEEPHDAPYNYWPENLHGDFIVDIKVIDPISDELLEFITFNERNDSKLYVSKRIPDTIKDTLKTIEAQKIAGTTEVIS